MAALGATRSVSHAPIITPMRPVLMVRAPALIIFMASRMPTIFVIIKGVSAQNEDDSKPVMAGHDENRDGK
jgi:hypothetical protein